MMGTSRARFVLAGHACPYGRYPAPAIPVGQLDGRWVAIYSVTSGESAAEEIEPDSVFVRHGPALQKKLRDFDYQRHRLFAYSAEDVCLYPREKETRFITRFLNDARFLRANPPIRAMLAQYVAERSLPGRSLGSFSKSIRQTR